MAQLAQRSLQSTRRRCPPPHRRSILCAGRSEEPGFCWQQDPGRTRHRANDRLIQHHRTTTMTSLTASLIEVDAGSTDAICRFWAGDKKKSRGWMRGWEEGALTKNYTCVLCTMITIDAAILDAVATAFVQVFHVGWKPDLVWDTSWLFGASIPDARLLYGPYLHRYSPVFVYTRLCWWWFLMSLLNLIVAQCQCLL